MHIGSAILVIWLVIGGFAAGQRGDYRGPVSCSGAATAAMTILAAPGLADATARSARWSRASPRPSPTGSLTAMRRDAASSSGPLRRHVRSAATSAGLPSGARKAPANLRIASTSAPRNA